MLTSFTQKLKSYAPYVVKARQSASSILVAVCVVCAAVLSGYMVYTRFIHLTNGFQYDELYSAITALPKLSFSFVWKEMLLQDINLPLFNVLLFGWNRIFPFTPVWMHLFSALLGALAVVMAWVCAPKYWTWLKKSIFTSLMACSFILSGYGAIVRTYSLSVLLATVFSLQALQFIDRFSRGENPSVKAWLVFFFVGLLGAYSHYFCSGLFFITALVVFLYACYYKVGRAWAFWGTAVVFALWLLWAGTVVWGMHAAGAQWWFSTPFMKATLEIIVFLFGPKTVFVGILYGCVLAGVSLVFTYKKALFKQADVILPLVQILLLLGVVAVVSLRVNLWMDRYFLPVLPSFFLLFAAFLDHLQKRHIVLLVLWPLLLTCWTQFYWDLEYLHWPEYTGLHDAFIHLTGQRQADKVLVVVEGISSYPPQAWPHMFEQYVPEGKHIEMIPISQENVAMSWQTNPKTPVLLPLCSQVNLLNFTYTYQVEEDPAVLVFNKDTCVMTLHPMPWRTQP